MTSIIPNIILCGGIGAGGIALGCAITYQELITGRTHDAFKAVVLFGALTGLLAFLLIILVRLRTEMCADHIFYVDLFRRVALPFNQIDKVRRASSPRIGDVLGIQAGSQSVSVSNASYSDDMATELQCQIAARCHLRLDENHALVGLKRWLRQDAQSGV